MHIRKATNDDLSVIYDIVHNTVISIYPNYYPMEVVDYFLNLHNEENILQDISKGTVYLLLVDSVIVGTGTLNGRYIGRVYVIQQYHGKGYGSIIMNILEAEISKEYNTSYLTSSLPSYEFYLRRGYQPIEYHKLKVNNDRILCYYEMEKVLNQSVKKFAVIQDNY